MRPARHVLHRHPLAVVPDHLVARHEVEQPLQRDRALHPGQRRAQTAVHPVSEAEVLRLGAVAVDVEGVGVGERLGIAVRRTCQQEHGFALRDRDAVQVDLFHGPAHVVLVRRLVPQQFLHRGGDLAAVVEQLLPLIGVARERHRRIAHQFGDGLRACATQKGCKSGDFEVVEATASRRLRARSRRRSAG